MEGGTNRLTCAGRREAGVIGRRRDAVGCVPVNLTAVQNCPNSVISCQPASS